MPLNGTAYSNSTALRFRDLSADLIVFCIIAGIVGTGVIFALCFYMSCREPAQDPQRRPREAPERHEATVSVTVPVTAHTFTIQSDQLCVICLESLSGQVHILVPCCHALHKSCAEQLLAQSAPVCPTCRSRITHSIQSSAS